MVTDHSDSEKGNPLPHIGYSFRLTARVHLYAPSHRQDSTYHGLCYTSRGALTDSPCDVSSVSTMLFLSMTSLKDGQPQRESNLASDENTGLPHTTHLNTPSSSKQVNFPENALQVGTINFVITRKSKQTRLK